MEEEENDDFENLYKGQVSKSGIAILPSKRTRKTPEAKKVAAAEVFEKIEEPIKKDEPLTLDEEVTE